MAESFNNYYTFQPGPVPAAETFRDALARQFRQPLELEKQEAGFKGAPRAYACLTGHEMQIWIYWQPDRPEVEVSVDEPMGRMIGINAAMESLGGKPRYTDGSWRVRQRYRTQTHIIQGLVIACAALIAIAMVWRLGWVGLLLVIAITAIVACLYVVRLARSFKR